MITGSDFTTGLAHPPGGSGWTAFSNTCTLLLGLIPSEEPVTCNTDTTAAAGIGAPPGSMQQAYSPPADGLAPLLLNATATARSSTFTIGAAGPTTFQFDRRADVQAILNGDSHASYTFTLVDVTAGGTRQELFRETLTDADNTFQGWLNEGLAPVVAGHAYYIELQTVFATGILSAALQRTIANFDNIRLRVQDGTAGFRQPTVVTLPADEIGATSARLNGTVNAHGLETTFLYRYSTSPRPRPPAPGGLGAGPFAAGNLLTSVSRPRAIDGLAGCTQYFFRIEATNSQGTGVGSTRSFRTDCNPSAQTLDVTGIGAGAATFNSRINPNGPETTYDYQYGTVASGAFGSRIPAAGSELTLAAGRSDVLPNSYPVGGLAPETSYQVRVVATNSIGTAVGNVVTFTTAGTAATGAPGPQGPAGPPGPPGAPATAGSGRPVLDLDSSSKLAMIRIDAKRIAVPMTGRNKGRVRVRIYCRSIAVRTCSGTMKVRTLAKINPAGFGFPARPARRVTWETTPVQLDVRKVGFAILTFPTQRLSLLQRIGRARSEAIVSVIDADNNRQNVRKALTVVRGR